MGERLSKAQVSMEFVFLVGVAFTVMVVFLASTRTEFTDLSSKKERSLVDDVAGMVQRELVIASNVQDGYSRTFFVPDDLDGISYNLSITSNTLLAKTSNYEKVLNVPSITGTVHKGNNTIDKTGGVIYVS